MVKRAHCLHRGHREARTLSRAAGWSLRADTAVDRFDMQEKDGEESIKMRGRDVAVGMRVVVWYEQADGKVEYHGTVTRLSTAQGARVWFDCHSYVEQEWVNQEDEWRFEDELAPPTAAPPGAAAHAPDPADEEDACEFHTIKLKLGKLSQLLPKAGKQGKRKRGADGAGGGASDKDAADTAAKAAAERAAAAARGPHTVYQQLPAGIFASERDHVAAGQTNLRHLKAPRRAPPSLLAKYGKCELSGRVAIYRDPLTGARFGSADAFRALRARHAAEGQGASAPKVAASIALGRGARAAAR